MNWRNAVLLVCILAGTAVLVGLGTWQVQRLHWKEGLIARVEANLARPPVPLDDVVAMQGRGEDIEYQPTSVAGCFLHAHEQYYFATFAGQTGRYVYTPLQRADGSVVWVNRGFVPQDRTDPATRPGGQIEGTVTVTGLARSAPDGPPNSLTPDNDVAANIYYWKSLPQMSAAAGLDAAEVAPLFVDAAREGEHAVSRENGGLPLGGVTRIDFPNSHLQYAVTWYGLALTLLLVGGTFLFRRLRGTDETPADAGA